MRIVLNGLRGWEGRKSRAKTENRRLYRTAGESMKGRILKKTTGKQNWFRKKKKTPTQGRIENTEIRRVRTKQEIPKNPSTTKEEIVENKPRKRIK